ncbi:histone-lysine N-methyltransferase 2A isoform X2 [Brienomyrus brachyistius]|uniref:histone-lysine N-methyltransferase 2A isoform X2 n=1 Tax=Brienomyrus brachyistius TaxID=42636 RepID=UPI0020B2BFE0|nr:histone-lysine N-methyltransferase 2A isoform X2 [Brienomyrus brachyistius]
MAHSCRWRFPARPGGITNAGSGRRAGRIRVTASLRTGTGTHPNTNGLGPGFDAALQVSAAIGNNLQKFRDVFGEASGSSSGEEEPFCGFGAHSENRRIQTSARTPIAKSPQEKKPRGRPPRALVTQRVPLDGGPPSLPASTSHGKPEGTDRPPEKTKRPPGRPPSTGEKRRGRPPTSGLQKSQAALEEDRDGGVQRKEVPQEERSKKMVRRPLPLVAMPLQRAQQPDVAKLPRGPRVGRISKITKIKQLRPVKLAPLKSRLKAVGRKVVPVPVMPRRKRGRPPSAERLKAEAAIVPPAPSAPVLEAPGTRRQKFFRVRPQHLKLRAPQAAGPTANVELRGSPSGLSQEPPTGPGRPAGVRQSPRRIKPVRIVPPSKRTDATIAKQLLQRAKKGAQKKKLLKEVAAAIGGQGGVGVEGGIRRKRRTQLKNIRQFIMPVVSTVSLRIIKTPKRFIEDEASFGVPQPHHKMARVDTPTPAAGPQPSSSPLSVPPVTIVSRPAGSAGAPVPVGAAPPSSAPGVCAVPGGNLLNSSGCNNSNGRFSSSAASCGSSAVSQHSSQLSSGESSRSSSPSLDSSSDSQASEGTQAPSEEPDRSPSSQGDGEMRVSRPPSPPSEPEHVSVMERGRKGRQGQVAVRGGLVAGGQGSLAGGRKKSIISPATGVLLSSSSRGGSKQASSTASSSSSPPPPPLLAPPQPTASTPSAISEHHQHPAWMVPHPIAPFIPAPVLSPRQEKRHSILREPIFRWTSMPLSEQRYFSSAKYAKEGLIRKPIFDNFRPPPLTPEDVGLLPPGGASSGAAGAVGSGFPGPTGGPGAGNRLFSHLPHHPHQHSASRFEPPHHKRSPLLRAPQFTPSAAHSRIFESVTLPPSSGSGSGSASSLQALSTPAGEFRRRRRRSFAALRGQPRSPSHSMTTRSSQSSSQASKGSSELSPLQSHTSAASSSSLPGVAVSPLAASALTPHTFNSFSSGSLSHPTEGAGESYQPVGRKAAGGLGTSGDSSSASSSPLFTLFASSTQAASGREGSRERGASASRETGTKEKEQEPERSREREKENKKEAQKERDRRGKSAALEGLSYTSPSLFSPDEDAEESPVSSPPKKTPGRKKCIPGDPGAETSPSPMPGSTDGGSLQTAATPLSPKGRVSKKGRPSDKGQEAEVGAKEKEREKERERFGTIAVPPRKPPTVSSLGSVLAAAADKQKMADRRVAGLLKKAQDQLYRIEKSKSLKSSEPPKVQGQESDSSETSARGPRIKHVCRRASVALGQNRAVFPDDMPTLSALPWEEREKILSSMGNDDKSSVAGSEEAEPLAPPIKPIKPVTRNKALQEPPARKGRRSRRCGQCPGCQVPDDCGVCTNCLDKPKFGGRNIKKQCCKERKCQNLQWMPSKAFLQKQAKAKKDKKKNKMTEKKDSHHSSDPKPVSPSLREEQSQKKSESPPPKHGEEKQRQPARQQSPPPLSPSPKDTPPALPRLEPAPEPKQPPATPPLPTIAPKKDRKATQPAPPATSPGQLPQPQPPLAESPPPAKKDGVAKSAPGEPKKKLTQKNLAVPVTETAQDGKQAKKAPPRFASPSKPKPKDKVRQVFFQERLPPAHPESGPLNSLRTPSTGGPARQKVPCDGVRRIRVDFKEDCDLDAVWEKGGLSLLTSVPISSRVVCFLCASGGHVEFVYCQVCCEPFHLFCLEETERPLQEQLENWCCRRCRFCHTCGHQHQKTKLLECNKCRNSYHPECLSPNHPTRPTKKKRVWICTKCVRCKSCGATTPGKAWDAQWSHDFSMCHDCTKLFAKGNFCPLCNKCCDDDDDFDSKMMQCSRCERWVHAKCENLSEEMHEVLSNLSDTVAYTCIDCAERHPVDWRAALEKELQASVQQVLTALLNSRTSTHLLRYRQAAMKPPELNPEPEESLPSRRSPEGPDPPVLTEVPPPNDFPLDLESVKRKMEMGRYSAVLEFSDDIVRIIQTAITSDGGHPESKRANSMLKSFFIRQMERVFPWFKVKESRFWKPQKVSSNSGLLPNAVLPPSLDHNYAQWREEIARAEQPPLMKMIIPAPQPKTPGEPDSPPPPPPPPRHVLAPEFSREGSPELPPPPDVTDNRQCTLCLKYGDDKTNDSGRLLYIGQNEWTHVNCALWSAEVFEDDDGSLKNVHMAVIHGKQQRCEYCHKPGATVSCCLTSCTSNFHFMCARLCHCVFLEDKKVYCQKHRDHIKGEVVSESGFGVTRRVLVDFEGINLRRKFLSGLETENVHMMIGSMTIDCLGILTELSDCEHKLFPIGYQCSRVYWSTLDARKRCMYTCRIMVCHPPVAETEVNSTVEHEDNRTISHSPSSVQDIEMSLLPPPGTMESPPTQTMDQRVTPATPKLKAAARSRHPSYPPCQRSPGSRPLPSPGPSNSTHEIVTVGDPMFSSSLRSIGSRRHSTSSLSPQPPKHQIPSPSRAGGVLGRPGVFSSTPSLFPASRDHERDGGRDRSAQPLSDGNQNRESRTPGTSTQYKSLSNVVEKRVESSRKEGASKIAGEECALGMLVAAPARVSQVLPGGTSMLAGHQKSSSSKTEKARQGEKDTELPGNLSHISRRPLTTLLKDTSTSDSSKDMRLSSGSASKEPTNLGLSQSSHHRTASRKPRDHLSSPTPAAAMKLPWSSGAIATEDTVKRNLPAAPASVANPGVAGLKETRSKGRVADGREAGKERERKSQNSIPQAAISTRVDTKSPGMLQAEELPLKARERFSSLDKKNSSTSEGKQSRFSPEKGFRPLQATSDTAGKEGSQKDKKRTVKVTLTPLKMDPNGTKMVSTSSDTTTTTTVSPTSQGSHRRPSRPLVFSPSASSESSESDPQHHVDDPEEHLLAQRCVREDIEGTDEGEEHPLEDGSRADKHQEEDSDGSGSAKRRYPRRSARARSNMFFGLTPFYGVRSYGEEDIPFYSSGDSSGKKRVGGGGSKRSAEGQVDGADDMSTSSSGDSGDDEECGLGQCTNEDSYYYNFTRTIIHPSSAVSPTVGMEECLGAGSQLQRFLKEETGGEDMIVEGGVSRARAVGRPRIGQLDGVDDGSESDASTNASTTAAATSNKSTSKRKGRESRSDKLDMDSGKEAETSSSSRGGSNSSSSNSRDNRKTQKENCLPLGGVKSQGQDPLDTQLSLNSELLKSDSDNTNSDDCGNILPSDIMEFVLNTPSMQALGQQQEAGSSELLSLDEGFGLDGNRGKDINLFEDFSQQLPSTEPVESTVNPSISGEESYGLPLELPSDLSVLTTRSPSVTNQNHGSLMPESSDRSILSLASGDAVTEKGGDKQRGGASSSNKNQQGGSGGGDAQVAEGHLTPEHFIPSQIEADHMSSPPIAQVVEPSSQELTRTSGTPGLPNSPSLPLQGQKYMSAPTESPASAQVASAAVQTTATHLKSGTEKLIVVNQRMQPLYVLQTLPNGVTQKIQIAPSVSTAGVMDTSSMTGGLTLTPGLSTGIPTSQSVFPPGGKGLVSMSHHPQIQAFTGAAQASFQPGIPSTTSGLLIGVHSQDPQVLVSEAGHHSELTPNATIVSSAVPVSPSVAGAASGHGKKRSIFRFPPRKVKKSARSGSQSTLTPEAGPNMTLINFSPTQISAGVPAQPGLVELGPLTTTATTSHRKVPNIIKRPKLGVYFEQTPLQGLSAPTMQPGILGHETSAHLVPCSVSGLNPSQSVLNVVSVPAGASTNLIGAPGLLGTTDISNLLLKASQQSLSLQEQQMVLQSGTPMISQLSSSSQTPNTNSICVLPPPQTISMAVNPQADQVGAYQLQHHPASLMPTDKPQVLVPGPSGPTLQTSRAVVQETSRCRPASVSPLTSRTIPFSRASDQQLVHKVTSGTPSALMTASTAGKGKQKTKRSQHSPDKVSNKKHKLSRLESPQENLGATNTTRSRGPAPEFQRSMSPELMETERPEERKRIVSREKPDPQAIHPRSTETIDVKPKTTALSLKEESGSGTLQATILDPLLDGKPKKGLMFEICSDDGFQIRCETIEEAWKSLTDKVREARSNARLKELSFEGVNGLRMLGVIHDAVVFLLEQLYGARHCSRYRFRFHKPEESDELPLNPHGAARAEQHHRRTVFDMFNFLASKHRQPPEYNPFDEEEEESLLKSARRAAGLDLPLPVRFRHLKKTFRMTVGVYRSAIHGRGLFCKRNIDAGEMVIEYSGNVIRSVLTDKREKYYESKGIGCYMFRIDDYEVVDATVHGNAARFINHSCEPNCYSRVLSVNGQKHIVIFTMRKIYRGEELTYDYKFPIEDPGNKLPCNCGAKTCRKFLN